MSTGISAPPTRPRRRAGGVWRVVAGIVALGALGAAGYFGWRAWSGASAPAERIVTAQVQRGDIEDAVTATGTLQPRDFVDVGTQVSGQLKKVHVDIGAAVRPGDLLAEIDPTVFQSKVDADRAQIRNQEAQIADRYSQLALAEQQQARQRNLIREEATSAEQLQQAEASVRSLSAQIEALRAQMQQTESTLRGDEANLSYTKIYAPMAGTVVSLIAKQGQTLNANQQAPTILRIADLSVMTVQAQVSEADVSKLRAGMPVYFTTLGSESRRWSGTLRQVNPTPNVANSVVLYDALFDVANPGRELMTQMTAQVFFVVASARDVLNVPVAALRPAAGGRRGPRDASAIDPTKSVEPTKPVEAAKAADLATTAEGTGLPGRGGPRSDRTGPPEGRREGGARPRGNGEAKAGAEAESKADVKGDAPAPRRRAESSGTDPRARFANARAIVRVVKEGGQTDDRAVSIGLVTRVSAQVISGLEEGETVALVNRGGPVGGGTAAGAGKSGPAFTPRM